MDDGHGSPNATPQAMLKTTFKKKNIDESPKDARDIKFVSAHCAQLILAAASAINKKSQTLGIVQPSTTLPTPPPMRFARWKVIWTTVGSSPHVANLLTHSKAAAVSKAAATETKYPYVLTSKVRPSKFASPSANQTSGGAMTATPQLPRSMANSLQESKSSLRKMRAKSVPIKGCSRDTKEVIAKGVVLAASLYARTAQNPNKPLRNKKLFCRDFCSSVGVTPANTYQPKILRSDRKNICSNEGTRLPNVLVMPLTMENENVTRMPMAAVFAVPLALPSPDIPMM
mmetsp:Transcript_2946/g.6538  ORF Transcript_2946/g.6538 Transcript_2946/m.6538 type:complete len:286 (-) Transcript_2946:75-932(-)